MYRYFRLITKAIRLLVMISILSTSTPASISAAARPSSTDKVSAEPATASRDRRALLVPEPGNPQAFNRYSYVSDNS